ncbi:DNA-binding protein [Maridesulfovibrio sp.]|uniref:DNA-binding protein n=1 Tax=Maridesulfovibrio sp. TaxID=2795000 RepID=UPI0029CA40B3|nr:DNA-binding protein [Maridesulfovibrio sp.]
MADIKPAYINRADAAEYVGYSAKQFGRYVTADHIPTYGPKNSRYKVADLDSWMEDRKTFTKKKYTSRRRPKEGFTPVAV